ncbi:hypothetical protein CONPUDRAFT_78547 [Coniophora puteana RWD-64-598 SS2]|uniref:Uncharacterized protein n=1 Tax=Coniophora puteana (strain RWD-64-598) TaxID=741705 RepID=A0A5M3N3F9_CONPW|nr:uncharacterized protein CONPUDRAFT_78547 [Coniophora puteana RWD-64-598 SS2]EIW85942.1 hypothetical protein CONPUDRAFT_78547 [Coniophora puteana RWD-64-598 SS2]
MREAVTCAAYDNACQYTLQDEVMLAGPPPPLPEEVLAEANTPDGGQWWDTQMFYTLVRPYTYGMTQVAFNSFDWSARRRASLPFSLPRLRAHMAALKTLHTLLALAHTRFAVAFGAEATSIRLSARASFGGLHTRHGTASANAKAQHRQDNAREAEQADRDAARAVLGAMESAMAHVNIPIWVDVEARLAAATAADQEGDDVVMLRKVMNGLRRALLPYVVRMLGQGAGVGDGGFVESNVSLAALTQLGDEPAKFWTWVILSSIPVENGGEGITRAQKLHTLESVYKIYKVISWAWPRVLKTDTAIRVKTALEMLRLEHMFDEIYGPTSCGVSDPMTGASTPDTESDQAGSHSSSSPSASGSSGSSQWHTSESASSILDLPDVEAVLRSTGILDEPLTPSRRSPIFMNTRNNLSLRGAGSEVAGFLTSGLTSTPMDLPMTDPGGVSLDLMTPYLTKNAVQVPSMLTVTLPETCQDRSNLSYDAHGAALEQLRGTMQALE